MGVDTLGTSAMALSASAGGRQPTRRHALNSAAMSGSRCWHAGLSSQGASGPTTDLRSGVRPASSRISSAVNGASMRARSAAWACTGEGEGEGTGWWADGVASGTVAGVSAVVALRLRPLRLLVV